MKLKSLFSLLVLFLAQNLFFAQSTDLDHFYFYVKYVRLPQKYTEPERRTYNVVVSDNTIGVDIDPNLFYLNSFKREERNAHLNFDVKLNNPITYSNPEVIVRQEEIKDKEGNVKSVRTFYRVMQRMEATQRYLLNGENYGSVRHSETFNTLEYSSSTMARENFLVQQDVWRNKFKTDLQTLIYQRLNDYMNKDYGQSLVEVRENLWLLGSKKHPEYENQQKAFEIIKDALSKVEYFSIPESVTKDIAPAIEIFEKQIKSYAEDNRKNRKVRYSAYYNLMKIYYYLDNLEAAEKYANLLVENDYDKKDGKNMLESIQNRKRLQDINKINSSHIKVLNEDRYIIKNY